MGSKLTTQDQKENKANSLDTPVLTFEKDVEKEPIKEIVEKKEEIVIQKGKCQAFICLGNCGTYLDKKVNCSLDTCKEFKKPLTTVNAFYDEKGIAIYCENKEEEHSRCNKCHVIYDNTQLPALVPSNLSPNTIPFLYKDGVAKIIPKLTSDCFWAGRKVTYKNVVLNGKKTNQMIVFPRTSISISLDFESSWSFNQNDYCPGCIVQAYYGLDREFSQGIIQYGIHDEKGNSQKTFNAPREPGIYYITNEITLEYSFAKIRQHHNSPDNAFAVIRVIPLIWSKETHHFYKKETKQCVIQVLHGIYSPKSQLSNIPIEIIEQIFEYYCYE